MRDFEDYLAHCLDDVAPSRVVDAMRYSLMAGGKRIRPRLLFAVMQAYGCENIEIAYPAGAALEMIHTYSLIHDDLPAMDDDTLRRGKPTCHVHFDEACAILAGDALLTHAFYLCTLTDTQPVILRDMVMLLSQYSGANGMVLGQIKDIENETNTALDIADLEEIHYYKTGKLLTLPLLMAAALSNRKEHFETWEKIGKAIGLSFQIQDDILDVTSSSDVLGKNIASDAENNKQTYATLFGIEEAQKEADRYYQYAFEQLHTLSVQEDALEALLQALMKRQH